MDRNLRVFIIGCEDPLYSHRIYQTLFQKLPGRVVGVAFAGGLITTQRLLKTPLIYGPAKFFLFGLEVVLSKYFGGKIEKVCKKFSIPLQKEVHVKSKDFQQHLRELSPDLILSINCNEYIGKTVREIAPLGVINLHNGMLPKYRGLMPILHAIRNGEKKSGITVHYIESGEIDSGPIIEQREVEIESGDTLLSVWDKSTDIGAEMLVEVISRIEAGEKIERKKNNAEEATYYTIPSFQEILQYHKQIKM